MTGELSLEDLEAFKSPVVVKKVGPPIERITQLHHLQARLLAEGKSVTLVAASLGTSVERLKVLQNDPTFCELVAYYQSQKEAIWLETEAKAKSDREIGYG